MDNYSGANDYDCVKSIKASFKTCSINWEKETPVCNTEILLASAHFAWHVAE